MTVTKYIGLQTTYSEAEGGGIMRAAYPEGHVALVNAKGELGAFVGGKDGGMRVDAYKVFDDAQAAFAWVTEK